MNRKEGPDKYLGGHVWGSVFKYESYVCGNERNEWKVKGQYSLSFSFQSGLLREYTFSSWEKCINE